MNLEQRVDRLEEDLGKCKTDVGGKVIDLEKEALVRMTRLETQMIAMSAALLTFVNHSQFKPVMLIAYGLAGGVLTTVLGAVLAKVLHL